MKGLLYALAILLGFTLQTTAYHFFGPLGVWPDFALILALYGGFHWGKERGAAFGALLGFIQDILSWQSYGFFTFSKGVTGWLVGLLKQQFLNDMLLTYLILVIGATLFDAAVYGLFASVFLDLEMTGPLLKALIPQILLNVGFSFAFTWLLERIRPLLDRLGARDKYRFDDVLR
ncbi:MAG: rod shape-determining protein MreD [Nitrospinae bacterium]|nr:rod shape-determining protein MreD [Nitrospinota bacterium]